MTTSEKKRILNTVGVRGELKLKNNWDDCFINFSFKCVSLVRASCVLMEGNKRLNDATYCYIKIKPSFVILWNTISDLGKFEQRVAFKNIEILYCIYPGIKNNSI